MIRLRHDGLLLHRRVVLVFGILHNCLVDHAHVDVGFDALALVCRQGQV